MTPTHNSARCKQSAVEAKQDSTIENLSMSKELLLTGPRNVYVSIPHPNASRRQCGGEILSTMYSTRVELLLVMQILIVITLPILVRVDAKSGCSSL